VIGVCISASPDAPFEVAASPFCWFVIVTNGFAGTLAGGGVKASLASKPRTVAR
jgi:hypothetical protein